MTEAAKVDLLIGGRRQGAADGGVFERRNPLSGDVVTSAAAASPGDAIAAADAAAAALPAWSALGPGARRAILSRAADQIEARAEAFVAAMVAETGATEGWARFNVALGAGVFREAAAMTTQIGGEVIPSERPGCLAMAVRRPAGVVLGIAPWNAPVILGARAIAMPLACGNTVVLKTSEASPATQSLLADALSDAGAPAGVVNVVSTSAAGSGPVVAALIGHPAVRRINFTGSTRVGRIIAGLAAEHLKPALLELGGKAPLVVLDDADLDAAVDAVIFGAFMNQGQICMSTERVVVDEAVADLFVDKLAARASALRWGDPRAGAVHVGAMIDVRAADAARVLVAEARAAGAVVVAGETGEGALMGPTVVDQVTSDMRLYRDESFGPVVAVIRARGLDDAVRIANDSDYGLSAAVFGRDVSRALAVAERIESGICHVNGPTVHDEAQMPFGGVKASGYGRFGGRAGIDAFTELRWITLSGAAPHYPF